MGNSNTFTPTHTLCTDPLIGRYVLSLCVYLEHAFFRLFVLLSAEIIWDTRLFAM